MKISFAAVPLFCLLITAVHAGEPWPENVCRTLAGYEQKDIGYARGDLIKLAYARSNVLRMLRNHCGVDISAKEAADVAAVKAGTAYGGSYSSSDIDRGADVEIDSPRRSNSMHCTTMAMGGGLSATDCE